MKIAAIGRTHWLYDAVLACVAKGHEIVLLATRPAPKDYRKHENDFAELAKSLRCEFSSSRATDSTEFDRLIDKSKADIAISVNWPSVISMETIARFPKGIINAHCGDLPRFRGNACPNWAILNNEEKVVVSLHFMTSELDAGPILLQRELLLTPSTYIQDVYTFISSVIPDMFVNVLDGLALDSIRAIPQCRDLDKSLRCYPRIESDGEIDWMLSAEFIARLVRASSEPFSGAFSFLNSHKLTVWRAHPEHIPSPVLGIPGQVTERRPSTGEVAVLTGDGLLLLEVVQLDSQPKTRAVDVLSSVRHRLGMNYTDEIQRLKGEILKLQREDR